MFCVCCTFLRFYTALALQELVNEVNINSVAAKYKFTRGQLQSLQQMASTFAGVVTHFCTALNWNLLALIIGQFKERLFFGVHRDLIDLMRLQHLNGARARALFDGGCKSLADLATANVLTIERILFDSVSFDAKRRDGETDFEAAQRNKVRFLYVTGRAGLTIREAAKLMVEDARRFLEMEMGVQHVQWRRDGPDEGSEIQVIPSPKNLVSVCEVDGTASMFKNDSPEKTPDSTNNQSVPKQRNEKPVLTNLNIDNMPTVQPMLESEDLFQAKSPTNLKRKSNDSAKENIQFEQPMVDARRSSTRKSPRIEAQQKYNTISNSTTSKALNKSPQITPTKIDTGRESDCEIVQTPIQTQRNRSARIKASALKSARRNNRRPTPSINTPNPMRNQLIDVDDMDSIGFSRSDHSSSTSLLNSSHIMSAIKQSGTSEEDHCSLNKIHIINVCGDAQLFRQFTETVAASKVLCMAIAVAHNMPTTSHRTQVIGGNLLAGPPSADDSIERLQRNCVFDEGLFYVTGIAFALDDSAACFYVNMQMGDDSLVSFDTIIKFLTVVCSRSDLTIRIYDAKEQCKVLRQAVPSIPEVVCSLEDPRIAYWLLDAEGQAGLKDMVSAFNSIFFVLF